jgi:hypothetical protein
MPVEVLDIKNKSGDPNLVHAQIRLQAIWNPAFMADQGGYKMHTYVLAIL